MLLRVCIKHLEAASPLQRDFTRKSRKMTEDRDCENCTLTHIGNLINYKYCHIIHEEIIPVDLAGPDR